MTINQTIRQVTTLVILGTFGPGLTGSLQAQELEEIVVTAQKRVESLQDTPLAVSALNAEDLQAFGIHNLSELTTSLPSLQAYDFPTSSSNQSIFMRGIGNPDSQTLTIDNPVGIYVDGVYIARSSAALMELLDLERVEVLRGPQGTLYGRNSTAGAINFITREPGEVFGGQVELGAGNFGVVKATASIDLPFNDTFKTKLSLLSARDDGWVKNRGEQGMGPGENFNMKEQQAVRLAISWQPTSRISVDYSFDYADVDTTPQYYQQITPGADFDDLDRAESTSHVFLGGAPFRYVLPASPTGNSGHNVTLEAELGDSLTLKSITGSRSMKEHSIQNWSDVLFFAADVDWETEAFSQELQLLGQAERLEYIVGIYYFSEDGKKAEQQFLNFDAASGMAIALDALAEPGVSSSLLVGGTSLGTASYDTELKSSAIFAQATWVFSDRFDLTAGLRYTDDERDALRAGARFNPANPTQCFGQPPGLPGDTSITFCSGVNSLDYSNTDWTLVADWKFSDVASTYLRLATGFRAGGSAERAINFAQTFDKETADSIELGFKSELADRRLRLNAAIYRTTVDDFILTLNGPTPDTAGFVENFNIGEARLDGLEVDLLALVAEQTRITLNYSYLDTELEGLIVPAASFLLSGQIPGTVDQRGEDISGSTFIPQAPTSAYTLAIDHNFGLQQGSNIAVHLDYVYRDDVFSQPARGLPVKSLGIFNARIAWRGVIGGEKDLEIALWGKNLADAEQVIYDLNNFGVQFNRPLSYGLDFRLAF